jgi:hypothetical protein
MFFAKDFASNGLRGAGVPVDTSPSGIAATTEDCRGVRAGGVTVRVQEKNGRRSTRARRCASSTSKLVAASRSRRPTPDAPASGALGIANITPGIVTQPGVITGIELRPSVF